MPRSMLDPDDFFLKMKKKPALQKILDNIDSYTRDELANVQGQPKWIRDTLVKLKDRNGMSRQQYILANTHYGENNDPNSYDVREWMYPEEFLPLSARNKTEYQMTPGQLIMMMPPNMVRVDHILSPVKNSLYQSIIDKSRYVDSMTDLQYRAALQERILTKFKNQ